MSGGYHSSRLPADRRREVLWQVLWRFYFSKLISPRDCVLDLGCGYGSFINTVVAERRIAVDAWPECPSYLAPGVEAVVGSVTELGFLADNSVDFAFASNLFEHITQADLASVLEQLRAKLRPEGTLTIVQPNYRYAFRQYFDDYTHITVYSHVSLADFLTANGYDIVEVRPRFMPLTIKSRIPVSPLLIRAYLASPVKPLGKQMLLRARPRSR
ncbi:MAG TPA: class I SAM-dependent methyltransferase [Acetobacteraceae bacterium]|jgi:SAM-dependent methyltransferase